MAKHIVKCAICGMSFDANVEPFVKVSSRRYAHQKCSENKEENLSQIEKDKEALDQYIMKLFNITYIDPRIRKQIKQYIEEYHYTYSGVLKALIYHYEIKGGDIDKANGALGIVPYVYQKAYNYYYSLWEAQQKNKEKIIEYYVPKVKEIIIPAPERKVKKRKNFSFLDEEE
jgi:hypothetical protein